MRQLPQHGKVKALVNLAWVGGAAAEKCKSDTAVAAVFVREGKAGAERDLRADDAVPAVEFMLDAEHVHRAALALRDAGLAPRQLGHDDLGIDTIGRSEEHTSELQSLMRTSYAVFCLKQTTIHVNDATHNH